MIRMHVVEGFEYTNATLSDGREISINVPSDKIKIITPTFEIREDEITTIILDLQVDKIHLANNPEHNLSPALKIEVIIEYSEVAESSLVQNHYRWAMNDYEENPTFIDGEDTPINDVAVTGEVLRLRLSIKNTETFTWSDNIKLKVQYTTDFTDWYDLKTGSGTGIWIFYDGLGKNKAEIEYLYLSGSTVNEHFVETTPTAVIKEISSNEQGEWDICIVSNGASPETTYYFRFVLSDGTLLEEYEHYPTVTTSSS